MSEEIKNALAALQNEQSMLLAYIASLETPELIKEAVSALPREEAIKLGQEICRRVQETTNAIVQNADKIWEENQELK